LMASRTLLTSTFLSNLKAISIELAALGVQVQMELPCRFAVVVNDRSYWLSKN